MSRKIIHILGLLSVCFFSSFAQNTPSADKVLTDVLNSVKTTPFKTNFKLTISDKAAAQEQSLTGAITIKGTKFFIDITDMKVWNDGRTQWVYTPQNNEVSISEPTEKELAETNPIAILSALKPKCAVRYNKKKSSESYWIDMIPNSKSQNISKVEVQVNKSSLNLVSVKLADKKGNITMLTLSGFQKGIKITDDSFVFGKAKYKGVVENDLR